MSSSSGISKKRCACISASAFIGVLLLVMGCVLITVFDNLIHSEVDDNVPLKVGSESYTNWEAPPVPIYFQVWMYDVVNHAEISEGEKPVVVQRGPYTYREKRQKVDIKFNEDGTVQYLEDRSFFFRRDLSVGPEEDTFHSINLPILAIIDFVRNKFPILEPAVNLALIVSKDRLFTKLSVKDLMWGYKDPLLDDVQKIIDKIKEELHIHLNITLPVTFGLFAGKNGTDDGLYKIHSGQKGVDKFGVIQSWNKMEKLKYWTSDIANMINGSDGTIYPPFSNVDDTKFLFSSDLCRSLGMDHSYKVTNRGIPTHRYIAPEILFANHTVNPANAGFCTPAGNCLPSGLLNVSACQPAPITIVMSMPNFLGCDPEVIDSIIGVHPNKEEHQSFLDVEPMTGVVMNAGKRLQINVILEKVKGIPALEKIKKRLYFPVMWLNESATIDEADAIKFKDEVLDKIKLTDAIKYSLMAIGGFVIAVAIFMLIKSKNSKKADEEARLIQNGDLYGAPTRNGSVSVST